MLWAALVLVAASAASAVYAWYISTRQLAATTEAGRWRVLRLGVVVSAGVGFAILALGVAGFVLTGYDWVVLAAALAVWPAAPRLADLGIPPGTAKDRQEGDLPLILVFSRLPR